MGFPISTNGLRYFLIEEDRSAGYTGFVEATNKWGLPGVHCPACDATWAGGFSYPCVDLTPPLPVK